MPDQNDDKSSQKKPTTKQGSAALITSAARTLLFHPWDTLTKFKQTTDDPYSQLRGKTTVDKAITLYRGATPSIFNTFIKFGTLSLLKPWQKKLHNELGDSVVADIASGTSLSALQTISQPLGTVKTRFQLGIYPDESLTSHLRSGTKKMTRLKGEHLYYGSKITFVRSSIFLTTTALSTPLIESALLEHKIGGSDKKPNLEQKALSGFLGGFAGMVAMAPADFIKTKQQSNRGQQLSAWDIGRQTFKNQGIKGFYKGFKYNLPELCALGLFSYLQAKSEESQSEEEIHQKSISLETTPSIKSLKKAT